MLKKFAGPGRRLSRREQGFTLIELVVVIAIIAILIAVAIPIYQNVTRSAAQKAHDTNLRSIDLAVQQFHFDKDFFPGAIDDLVTDGFLEEIPAIPAVLKGKDEYLSGEQLDSYYLSGEDPPRAEPTGMWDGAYRKK